MDDDDEERSRSIPSRTRIGKRAALIEKFPALGQPLMLFGGLITVPFWEYRNLSAAYLDVMISDLPRVDYNTKEKETFTEEDQQEAMKRTKELQEKVKNGFFNKRLSLDNQKSIQSLLH